MPATAAHEPAAFNITSAALALGVSRVTIWRWIRDGRLPAVRLGHRTVQIPADAVARLATERLAINYSPRLPSDDGVRGISASVARRPEDGRHFVQFYERDEFLVEFVADLVGAGLRAGDAGIVIGTASHQAAFAARWERLGIDVAAAQSDGRLTVLDAEQTLSQFRAGRAVDRARCCEVLEPVIRRAVQRRKSVRIFGEMVALLAAEGSYRAAVDLEKIWGDLQSEHPFSLWCAYPVDVFRDHRSAAWLDAICDSHTMAIPAESFPLHASVSDRWRAVLRLQIKARGRDAARDRELPMPSQRLEVARDIDS